MKNQSKKAKWVVKIFEGAIVLVKEGDMVNKGDTILTSEKKEVKMFDASIVLSKVSRDKVDEIAEAWRNKEVSEGELLFEEKGLFSKKFFSFCSGTFVGIDEFYNICIEEKSSGEKKEILSPVRAKVSEIDSKNITLEFKAFEFEGEGVAGDRVWGKGFLKKIDKINELNYSLEDNVIVTSNSEFAFVTKASVVGVKGLIVAKSNKENFDKIETELPILALEDTDVEKLVSNFGDKKIDVLLNAKTGRLLVVDEQNEDEKN